MFDPRYRTRTILLAATLLASLPATGDAEASQRFGLWPLRGNGALRLVRHDVQIAIDHPVATTTLTQEFENPTGRSLEAYYYYPVPEGAAVANLALWVNGVRREARVLERQKAREIYQGIVDQERDPALVERLSGNLFRIRIFPVLPHRRTRIELELVQTVEADGPAGRYRLVLPRPPGETVEVLRLGLRLRAPFDLTDARLAGHPSPPKRIDRASFGLPLTASQRRFEQPIVLRYRAHGPPKRAAVAETRGDDGRRHFVAEIPRRAKAGGEPRQVVVLVDRSRSMGWLLGRAEAAARALVGALGPRDRVAVVPFDLLPRGPVAPVAPAAVGRIAIEESRLGTAFLPAFRAALSARPTHVVCISDGGDRYHQGELERLARELHDRGGVRVSAVHLSRGAPSAEDPLRALTRVTGGGYLRLGRAGQLSATEAKALLATDEPGTLRAARTGEIHLIARETHRVLVAGALPPEAPPGALAAALDSLDRGAGLAPSLPSPAAGALYAEAAIARRMARIKLFGEEPPLIAEIIALSKRHRVVSEYTAMLVTETDADYQRPTSGRKWQRRVARAGDQLPTPPTGFQSTPEPHEWALIALGLALLYWARRRGWLPGGAAGSASRSSTA